MSPEYETGDDFQRCPEISPRGQCQLLLRHRGLHARKSWDDDGVDVLYRWSEDRESVNYWQPLQLPWARGFPPI